MSGDGHVDELRALTACRCKPEWADRNLHDPHCVSDYRDDVDALATDLARAQATIAAVRALLAEDEQRHKRGSCLCPGVLFGDLHDALDGTTEATP